jgi:hypothetical protein
MSSPSIKTSTFETRKSYIPSITNEVGAFVGYFEKGPIHDPVFITNINQFKQIFGRGIGLFHNDWYQVYNYLQYSSGIWVVRAAGSRQYNANNLGQISIQNDEDWEEQYDSIETPTDGIRVIAKTPGEAGNLISIAYIHYEQYQLNVVLNGEISAQDAFSHFQDGRRGLVVFRNNKIMETYYFDDWETTVLDDSKYCYFKFDVEFRFTNPAFQGDTGEISGSSLINLEQGSTNLAVDTDLEECYELLANKGSYDIDIVIGNQLDNNLAINLAESRRDCIAFIGLPTSLFIFLKSEFNYNNEVIYTEEGEPLALFDIKHSKNFSITEDIREYLLTVQNSQFVHFTMNIKNQYDGFTGKNKLVNIAADTAGLKAQASLIAPFTPGAGLEKGVIKNGEIFLNISKTDKDKLYKKGLNIIDGSILTTQKTFYTKASAFNRINVRSMFNHLERAVEKVARKYVFEENKEAVRRSISSEVKRILVDMKSNKGIQAGRVYAYPDDNNPNLINVDITVKPTYMTEFINLRMNNVGTNTMTSVISNTIG